ncbi:hypothetical protein FV233_30005, partial [Methylobacterium sp. WL7]
MRERRFGGIVRVSQQGAINPIISPNVSDIAFNGIAPVDMIARNMARMGLRPLFRKMLKLVVANQDRARTIRLRDEWVEFD